MVGSVEVATAAPEEATKAELAPAPKPVVVNAEGAAFASVADVTALPKVNGGGFDPALSALAASAEPAALARLAAAEEDAAAAVAAPNRLLADAAADDDPVAAAVDPNRLVDAKPADEAAAAGAEDEDAAGADVTADPNDTEGVLAGADSVLVAGAVVPGAEAAAEAAPNREPPEAAAPAPASAEAPNPNPAGAAAEAAAAAEVPAAGGLDSGGLPN